jgi:hypothetical protein
MPILTESPTIPVLVADVSPRAKRSGQAAPRLAPLQLTLIRHPSAPDSLDVPCSACGTPVEVHQPDSDDPEFVLGTCSECGQWLLIASDPDGQAVQVLVLPTKDQLRAPIG